MDRFPQRTNSNHRGFEIPSEALKKATEKKSKYQKIKCLTEQDLIPFLEVVHPEKEFSVILPE